MSWNYRIHKTVDHNDIEIYSVRETYYRNDGGIWGFSNTPEAPISTTPQGLIEELELMILDIQKSLDSPLIDDMDLLEPDFIYSTYKHPRQNHNTLRNILKINNK